MTPSLKHCAVFLSLGLLPMGASAETVYDVLFKTGTLTGLASGDHIAYQWDINTGAEGATTSQATIEMDVNAENTLEISRVEGDHTQVLGTFPQEIGNPMNMYFLEKLVEMVSEQTGGSPFYIRNSVKAALITDVDTAPPCEGAFSGEANCLVMRPFADGNKAEQLGRFANLQVEALVDADDPAWIVGMEAVVPEGAGDFVYRLQKEDAQ